jgi:transcriptional regulator with XRE-family HTH domain
MPQKRTPRVRITVAHAQLGRGARELRARQNISQEELGYRAGLHRNYVGAVERGELNPTFTSLLALTGGLGITMGELIERYEYHCNNWTGPSRDSTHAHRTDRSAAT